MHRSQDHGSVQESPQQAVGNPETQQGAGCSIQRVSQRYARTQGNIRYLRVLLLLYLSYTVLTRALLGLWIFHRLLGGGGVWKPPPWSRLLVAVEKNERQRSKAREKSFRNHLDHFLAQVKIGVSRGQNSKIFQNGFSTIKSLILKIEQRIGYHRVCLVKARRTIYKMTLKGQG